MTRTLPTGTLTFLFTDIEGSTARWERSPGRMSALLKAHDALLEDAIARNGGHVFKKMGDSVCASFSRASSAATAAIEAQKALAKADFGDLGPINVRIALHTGEAEERAGDYFGPALNRVARLLAAGYGQQILVSATTAELLASGRNQTLQLRNLGAYQLRDIAEPEEVFQIWTPGLREHFPRLHSLDAAANNLPSRITSFVGRDDELLNLKGILKRSRLLTLAGTGGVGKTRLAIELGSSLVNDYPDGVWLVELATIAEPELLPGVVATALNLQTSSAQGELIESTLAQKRLLLLMDNCEHVIGAAADLLDRILKKCPNVQCVATSREPLGLIGETVHRVSPLTVPDIEEISAGEALRYSAVRLFEERARRSREDFAITDENAVAVIRICRQLDGIPLAVELVVAQLRALTLAQLLERLEERLPLPLAGSRTALPRHLTIESLIAWSYGLLEPPEQELFRKLSIFNGSFSLEATKQICAAKASPPQDILRLLTSLVDQSLLFHDVEGGTERYRMLQTTRQYAIDKLRSSAEYEATAQLHAAYFKGVAIHADEEFQRAPHEVWLRGLMSDLDNIRAVLSWALAGRRHAALGAEIVGRLDRFWFEAGLMQEAQAWIDRALTALGEEEHMRERARLWLARSLFLAGEDRLQAAQRSASLYESIGDTHGLARALREVGIAQRQIGRMAEATKTLQRAVDLLAGASDAGALALALNSLGALYAYSQDFARAREIYSEALDVARQHNAQYALMMGYLHLADLNFSSGDCASAVECALQALPLAEAAMSSRFYANLKYNLAAYKIGLHDLDGARADAVEALRIVRANHDSFQVCNAVLHLAYLACAGGDTVKAAKLIGYSDAYLKLRGMEREPTENWVREQTMQLLSRQTASRVTATGLELGAAMTEEQALSLALG